MKDPSLHAVLTSGSSRVFNCAAVFERLSKLDPPPQPLFRTRVLNASVLIKDTPPPELVFKTFEGITLNRRRVATKVYLPYDPRDVFAGGRTVYYGTKEFEKALADLLDLTTSSTREAFTLDCYVLDMIDGIPSVSPFLLRDKFRLVRLQANPAYFDVPAEEWAQIDTYVRGQLAHIVRSLYGEDDPQSREQFNRLLDILWDLGASEELTKLGRLFRIPEDDVVDTFFAWKGVIFYSYEHARRKEAIYAMLRWLEQTKDVGDAKSPSGQAIQKLVVHLLISLSKVLVSIETKLTRYQDAFNDLFLKRSDYEPFFEFLQSAQSYFQSIGVALARLDHLTEIWERGAGGPRRLSPEQRAELLRVLADHGPSAEMLDA